MVVATERGVEALAGAGVALLTGAAATGGVGVGLTVTLVGLTVVVVVVVGFTCCWRRIGFACAAAACC